MQMDELEDILGPEYNKEPEVVNNITEKESSESVDEIFNNPEKPVEGDDSIITDLLNAKGIENGEVTILDENNVETKVKFDSLSREEKMSILNPEVDYQDNDLDDYEIDFINQLREENLTVDEFLENYKKSILEEVGNQQSVKNYDIDAYDDQELFIIDLKNKYDLSDEELLKELNKELEDEPLFKKKVDALRTEYKQLEDQYNAAQQSEFEKKQEEDYNKFSNTMLDVAINTPEFYGIELEEDEQNEVLSSLLDLDENGASEFSKALDDPQKLYEAAWFLRYGKESFDVLKNAYETEINRLKNSDNKKPQAVHADRNSNYNSNNIKSIHDLT